MTQTCHMIHDILPMSPTSTSTSMMAACLGVVCPPSRSTMIRTISDSGDNDCELYFLPVLSYWNCFLLDKHVELEYKEDEEELLGLALIANQDNHDHDHEPDLDQHHHHHQRHHQHHKDPECGDNDSLAYSMASGSSACVFNNEYYISSDDEEDEDSDNIDMDIDIYIDIDIDIDIPELLQISVPTDVCENLMPTNDKCFLQEKVEVEVDENLALEEQQVKEVVTMPRRNPPRSCHSLYRSPPPARRYPVRNRTTPDWYVP